MADKYNLNIITCVCCFFYHYMPSWLVNSLYVKCQSLNIISDEKNICQVINRYLCMFHCTIFYDKQSLNDTNMCADFFSP